MPDIPKPKREKKWSQLYIRSNKLARAEQLGIDYPRVTEAQLMAQSAAETTAKPCRIRHPGQTNPHQRAFICSRNQWRSPTAENIWRRHPQVAARSAGTSPNARHPVSEDDLRWADVIFVMEEKHKSRLIASFRRVIEAKPLHVLDIPDEYRYMDPALVEELQSSVAGILGL